VALAAVLAELAGGKRSGFRLTLAHLDHGLRQTSARDAASVANLANQLNLPLISGRRDVRRYATRHKLGLEEAARVVRYDFLRRAAEQSGAAIVALGHHQDDQAETVLLNLLRGGDVRGLSGMPLRRPIACGSNVQLIRPLIELTRQELRDFLRRRDLPWFEDETNLSTLPLRNRIRLELLPLLERDYVPGISRRLAALAGRMSILAQQLQAEAERQWPHILLRQQRHHLELDRSALLAAGQPLAARMMCMALESLGCGLGAVSAEHLDAAWNLIQSQRGGRCLSLPQGVELCRTGGIICLRRKKARP
jgi:tRNA(Ile)-lysidine synthase